MLNNKYSIDQRILDYPMSNYGKFKTTADHLLIDFECQNRILELIRNKELTIQHFHFLLTTIFHQVYMSSTSFALAGVQTDSRQHEVRAYLYSHAEEEQDHWKWIIQNLYDSGFSGPDPREGFPSAETMTYISFANYLALRHPYARLAMGYILEDISGNLGEKYGASAAEQLGLQTHQMSFFIKHGQLDQGHSHDILEVLQRAQLTPYEWAWCEYAIILTQHYYLAMYNSSAVLNNEGTFTTVTH